jgi:hypothetical protein
VGFVVTSPEDENVLDSKIYDLLPYRCVSNPHCRRMALLVTGMQL